MQSDEDGFAALRTEVRVGAGECGQEIAARGRVWQECGTRRSQQVSAEGEFCLAVTVGKEVIVADAL